MMAFYDAALAVCCFLPEGNLGAAAGAGVLAAILLTGAQRLSPGGGTGRLYSREAWLALGVQIALGLQIVMAFYYAALVYSVSNDFSLLNAGYQLASAALIGQLRGWWLQDP